MIEIAFILNLLHYLFNRFIVIPISIVTGFGWWGAFFIAIAGDIIQMFIYFYILEGAGVNKKLGILISKRFPSQENVEKTGMVKRVRGLGYLGITILAALPVYFGGMYSAVLVSHLMHLNRKKSYICLTIGSIIGSAILVVGLSFIWGLIKSIIM
ncbi:MAG: small multi-drug export protein [Elusimicrobia bacterium]|nr:small multi-drug export protein [Elusimicrobiota bacterium]